MSAEKLASVATEHEVRGWIERAETLARDPHAGPKVAAVQAAALALADAMRPGTTPPPIDPIFNRIDRTFESFFRQPITGKDGDWKDFVINARADAQPGSIDLIVIPFVAPADYKCRVESNALLTTTQCAITENPGAILFGETAAWDKFGGLDSKYITWRSTPRVAQGNLLTPGKTYYLNFTSVNIAHFRATGQIRPMQVGALADRTRSIAERVP